MQRACRPIVLMLMASVFSVLPAAAGKGDETPKDILGVWSFQTKPYRDGECLMTGTMSLAPHKEKGQYTCELTAVEVCTLWGRSVVRQSCQARRFGDQVSIRSTIVEMLESKSEGLEYIPDNFTLTVQSGKRMFGALVSAVTAPAEFKRNNEGVS
jgi:hypothetical protein